LAGFASLLVASAGLRVASLNLCTDELLLALAEPDQIASVTHLAQQPLEYANWKEARRYSKNDGSLLSVVSEVFMSKLFDLGGACLEFRDL